MIWVNLGLAIDGGTASVRNAITSHLNSLGHPVWHWIDDFWIIQRPVPFGPKDLYNELQLLAEVPADQIMLVFELPPTIAHYGHASPKAWEWLKPIGIVR